MRPCRLPFRIYDGQVGVSLDVAEEMFGRSQMYYRRLIARSRVLVGRVADVVAGNLSQNQHQARTTLVKLNARWAK